MKKNRVAFISYMFQESDGVGAARSRALGKIIDNKAIIDYYTKDSWGTLSKKSFLIWTLLSLFHLLVGKYDKVYVSCGPFYNLIFISLVCFIKRLELIVDFRDPWSINMRHGYGSLGIHTNSIKIIISELIERITYSVCTYFVVCTPGMFQQYYLLFKDSSKLLVVLNGYDLKREDLELEQISICKHNHLRLVCLGKFGEYSEKKALRLLDSLRSYIQEKKAGSLSIEFVGGDIPLNRRIVRLAGMEQFSIFHGQKNYFDAMEIAAQADLGICIIRDEDFDFGTKVFDYIGLGIPIYDCFDPNSKFRAYFSDYVSKSRIGVLTDAMRQPYSRNNCFRPLVNILTN